MTTNPSLVNFEVLITVSMLGSGAGAGYVSSDPEGIACWATCSYYFDAKVGATVTLTPTTGPTWVDEDGNATWWDFVSWGGACTGTGVCSVALDTSRSITASFSTTDCVVGRKPPCRTY
jgi:hypothetical protein